MADVAVAQVRIPDKHPVSLFVKLALDIDFMINRFPAGAGIRLTGPSICMGCGKRSL